MRKIQELRQKRDSYLATAQRIVSTAVSEQRALSEKERLDVEGLRQKASDIAATLQAHDGIRDIRDQGEEEHEADQQRHTGAGFRQSNDGLGLGRIVRALAAGRGDPERAARHAETVYGDEGFPGFWRAAVPGRLSRSGTVFGGPDRLVGRLVVRRMGAVRSDGGGNLTMPTYGGQCGSYIGESDHIGIISPLSPGEGEREETRGARPDQK